MATKGEIVVSAGARLRISGLTTNLSNEDVSLFVEQLEDMAHEFTSRNICLNYNFTKFPDPADEAGVPSYAIGPLKDILAYRMAPYFGKEPFMLEKAQLRAMSILSSGSAQVERVDYSRRMPRGSGNTNRYNRWQRFYHPTSNAPVSCQTENITYGATLDYTYDISYFLTLPDGTVETVDTFTLAPNTTKLTINSSSFTGGILSYRVTCAEDPNQYEYLELVVTTDGGRVQNFRINFTTREDKVATQ